MDLDQGFVVVNVRSDNEHEAQATKAEEEVFRQAAASFDAAPASPSSLEPSAGEVESSPVPSSTNTGHNHRYFHNQHHNINHNDNDNHNYEYGQHHNHNQSHSNHHPHNHNHSYGLNHTPSHSHNFESNLTTRAEQSGQRPTSSNVSVSTSGSGSACRSATDPGHLFVSPSPDCHNFYESPSQSPHLHLYQQQQHYQQRQHRQQQRQQRQQQRQQLEHHHQYRQQRQDLDQSQYQYQSSQQPQQQQSGLGRQYIQSTQLAQSTPSSSSTSSSQQYSSGTEQQSLDERNRLIEQQQQWLIEQQRQLQREQQRLQQQRQQLERQQRLQAEREEHIRRLRELDQQLAIGSAYPSAPPLTTSRSETVAGSSNSSSNSYTSNADVPSMPPQRRTRSADAHQLLHNPGILRTPMEPRFEQRQRTRSSPHPQPYHHARSHADYQQPPRPLSPHAAAYGIPEEDIGAPNMQADADLSQHDSDSQIEKDSEVARFLQKQEETQAMIEAHNSVQNEHSEMLCTPCGRAILFVETVCDAWRRVLSQETPSVRGAVRFVIRQEEIIPKVEQLLEIQDIYKACGKPADIDLGYYFATSDEVSAVRTSGIQVAYPDLSRINAHGDHHNVHIFGEGVYTSDAFSNIAMRSKQVAMSVIRLKGKVGTVRVVQPENRMFVKLDNVSEDTEFDTLLGNSTIPSHTFTPGNCPNDQVVLKTAQQCLPLIQFPTAMVRNPNHAVLLRRLHDTLNGIISTVLNAGV